MEILRYWLAGMLTVNRREVCIPLEARMDVSEFKGIPVKAAYYTARYPPMSHEGHLAPMNHAETYVLDGRRWNLAGDIMVRTGNGLVGIKPEVIGISTSSEEGNSVVYQGMRLLKSNQKRIIAELDLVEEYKMLDRLRGVKTSAERIIEALSSLFQK